jgi:hypothetical protein
MYKQTRSCRLAVSHWRIAVVSESGELIQALQEKYPAFMDKSGDSPSLSVHVVLEPGAARKPGDADPLMHFEDSRLVFAAPGFRGSLDEAAREANLWISSDRPAADVDLFLRIAFGLLAVRQGGFLLHTSAIVREGLTYLFFGHSGSGKTTVSRFSSAYTVLNDDSVMLVPDQACWLAYSTPFTNPTQAPPTPLPEGMPVAGLYRLVKDQTVFLEGISQPEGAAEMISCTPILAALPGLGQEVLDHIHLFLREVPIFRLHFRKDDSFWNVIVSSR